MCKNYLSNEEFNWNFTENEHFESIFPQIKLEIIVDILGLNLKRDNFGKNYNFNRLFLLFLRLRQSCCHLQLITNISQLNINDKDINNDSLIELFDKIDLNSEFPIKAFKSPNLDMVINGEYESTKVYNTFVIFLVTTFIKQIERN